jgi:beta-glucosidase
VRLAAGQSAQVEVAVPTRHLAYWADGWVYEPGEYRLRVGTTAVDLPLETVLTVSA